LREKIWDPLLPYLEGKRRIFVVPDGTLHLVNLAALPSDQVSYLLQTGPIIHYLTAERDIAGFTETEETGRGLLAMGNPDFGKNGTFKASHRGSSAGDYKTGYEKLYFNALPQSELEARKICELWQELKRKNGKDRQPAVLLTGKAATEAAFKLQSPGKWGLHMATHGFFLNPAATTDPAPAGDRRSSSNASTEKQKAVSLVSENPLLLSGLALTGANIKKDPGTEEEDGILTAEEIAGLYLTGTRWAVLSGCDTGLGTIHEGEGVFGLRRALRLAGVRTVIMSLWPVEDKAARLWMETFYKQSITEGLSVAASAHLASQSLLRFQEKERDNTHPFFWAPFVTAGDWR
jgi:CHAT domain-containing protein